MSCIIMYIKSSQSNKKKINISVFFFFLKKRQRQPVRQRIKSAASKCLDQCSASAAITTTIHPNYNHSHHIYRVAKLMFSWKHQLLANTHSGWCAHCWQNYRRMRLLCKPKVSTDHSHSTLQAFHSKPQTDVHTNSHSVCVDSVHNCHNWKIPKSLNRWIR